MISSLILSTFLTFSWNLSIRNLTSKEPGSTIRIPGTEKSIFKISNWVCVVEPSIIHSEDDLTTQVLDLTCILKDKSELNLQTNICAVSSKPEIEAVVKAARGSLAFALTDKEKNADTFGAFIYCNK